MKAIIEQCRAALRVGDKKMYSDLKRKLPMFLFQAGSVAESLNGRGERGTWRKQEHIKLNGLVMVDLDKMGGNLCLEPGNQELQNYYEAVIHRHVGHMGILLVHITPSGCGLRIVAQADPERGNLFDNAKYISDIVGCKPDLACKDSSRGSFAVTAADILYLDEKIFDYDNDEYDKKFGPAYRTGGSRTAAADTTGTNSTDKPTFGHGGNNTDTPMEKPSEEKEGDRGKDIGVTLEQNDDGEYCFKGQPFKNIIDAYWKHEGGRPSVGERHTRVLQMANRLRYICDNNADNLFRVIDHCGLDDGEVRSICDSACAYKMAPFFPPSLRAVLQSLPKRESDREGAGEGAGEDDESRAAAGTFATGTRIDYQGWWERLRPLCNDPLRDAIAPLADEIKMGGTLAAYAMFGTYLTRCYWKHYDGEQRRLSYLVYIIGDAASGKSFAVRLDKLIMEPMKVADKAGREWEQQYKEDREQREASTKKSREAAQEIMHPVIRYIPSTISNAMLYSRLRDAREKIDGHDVHLHLYTFEAELATALRVQQGSWAGKLDLECKSFQNEEAGVDYAWAQSANGLYQVNWNQVVTGTPDAMRRKIKPATVLDGLVTRLAIFRMPEEHYTMIDRQAKTRDFNAESRLRSWGYRLETLKGELVCPQLVDLAYEWCERKAREAEMNGDVVADYFRKRVPFYIVRYGLVHAVLENYDRLSKLQDEGKPLTVPITKKTLQFAELIGDFIYEMQIRQFGEMVFNALENQKKDFVPRQRLSKHTEAYNRLPKVFTTEDVVNIFNCSSNAASQQCSRLKQRKYIKLLGKGKFKKLIMKI